MWRDPCNQKPLADHKQRQLYFESSQASKMCLISMTPASVVLDALVFTKFFMYLHMMVIEYIVIVERKKHLIKHNYLKLLIERTETGL